MTQSNPPSYGDSQHRHPDRHYLQGRLVLPSNLENTGVRIDSVEEADTYRRGFLRDRTEMSVDQHTVSALNAVTGRLLPMPLASKFIDICASSPWYRVNDVKIELGGVVEAPWVALEFLFSGTEEASKEEDIRIGSYLYLHDIELGEITEGLDYPRMHGQVTSFEGFDDEYAVVKINILRFLRNTVCGSYRYTTHRSFPPVDSEIESTLILIPLLRCRFPWESTTQFVANGLLTGVLAPRFVTDTLTVMSPIRTWDGKEDEFKRRWCEVAKEEE